MRTMSRLPQRDLDTMFWCNDDSVSFSEVVLAFWGFDLREVLQHSSDQK